jgi:hypothetical protein
MNRREALAQGGRMAAVAALWASVSGRTWAALAAPAGWSAADEELLNAVGDTILPATAGSPGAGSVGIGRFILTMTNECYPPSATDGLRRALAELRAECARRQMKDFPALTAAEREQFLVAFERRGLAGFRHLKDLTLWGYFTSEAGATQALRYEPIPGGYRGSVRLQSGDRSWAI